MTTTTLSPPSPTLPSPVPLVPPGGQYYHVYGKGARDRPLFVDDADYIVFLALLKQSLRLQTLLRDLDRLDRLAIGQPAHIVLHAYSLTQHTYQLILQQHAAEHAVKRLMHAVAVSYDAYFMKKYHTKRSLFNDVYRTTYIPYDQTLVSLSIALHSVAGSWERSSRGMYVGREQVDWLQTTPILMLAGGRMKYRQGLAQARRQTTLTGVSQRRPHNRPLNDHKIRLAAVDNFQAE